MSKLKLRRSTAEEYINGCQQAAILSFTNDSIGNPATQNGTAEHKKIEDSLRANIIPENIKFALYEIIGEFHIEEELTIEKDNLILSCTPDLFVIKGNKAVIFDWKFTQSNEQYVIDGYKYKTFQPLWYEFLLFSNFENIDTIMFQYVLPNSQDIIEPITYAIIQRDECYDLFEMYIYNKIKDIQSKIKNNDIKKDYSKCLSCFYSSACPEMNLNKLEVKSDISLKPDFQITQENAGDVYNLCSKLEKATKTLKDNIKKSMESGEITTFNISDNKCIELIEKAGSKRLNKDLLNAFLSQYNKSYDDFTEQGEPIKSMTQKKIK